MKEQINARTRNPVYIHAALKSPDSFKETFPHAVRTIRQKDEISIS
jgi:hypothetical protein